MTVNKIKTEEYMFLYRIDTPFEQNVSIDLLLVHSSEVRFTSATVLWLSSVLGRKQWKTDEKTYLTNDCILYILLLKTLK